MRLFTELDPDTYDRIQALVREGKYETVEQFLRVAAQNQLAIERTENKDTITRSPTEANSTSEPQLRWEYEVPEDIPTGTPFEEDRSHLLLFSQYYRFFPLKCALYKLAELTNTEGGPVSVDTAYEYISEEIEPIRDALVSWEEQNDIKKQNRKSTGLPKQDVKNPERSMRRYLNHYVGKVQPEKDQPAGFGHDLGYVAFDRMDGTWQLQLSVTGARFVQLRNVLLANGPESPPLSDEERTFIVTTIHNDLDEEYRFMKYIYDVLSETDDSYTNYLAQFRDFLEQSTAAPEEMSENNVRSQVGGAISRMVELGLLERGRRRGYYNTVRHPDEVESVSIPQS